MLITNMGAKIEKKKLNWFWIIEVHQVDCRLPVQTIFSDPNLHWKSSEGSELSPGYSYCDRADATHS